MACDPDFADVILLAHFSDQGSPTDIVDSSSYNQTMTAAGNGVIDTSSFKFPDGSLKTTDDGNFNGTLVTYDSSMDWPTEDWTIEFWVNPPSGLAVDPIIIDRINFTTIYPYQIQITAAGTVNANCSDGSGTTVVNVASGVAVLTPDVYNMIVFQRSGNTFSLFVNGLLVDSDTYAGAIANNIADLRIGAAAGTVNVDEVRFTKGLARYSGNFTPPTVAFGGECPTQFEYPELEGITYEEAQAIIALTVFGDLAPPVFAANAGVAVGLIFLQSPPAHSLQNAGTVGTVTVSTGAPSDNVVVPQIGLKPATITPLTPGQANALLVATGLVPGPIDVSTDPSGHPGTVFSQGIAPGTVVPRGTAIPYTVSTVLKPFDPSPTVISQYANSETLKALCFGMSDYLRPDVNFEAFYNFVWNVDTAQGFGLDIWGKIVGVSRLLHIPVDSPVFGFENSDDPPDWSPFNQGTFYTGSNNSQTYTLPDAGYRILILTKALANIAATTAPSLNRLLQNLFPGRGKAYVVDLGNMAMRYVFEFSLSSVEFAILTQSGALPHPAGVSVDVQVVPTGATFGFSEQGGEAQPFDQGVFAP